jgi:hypothetical protein
MPQREPEVEVLWFGVRRTWLTGLPLLFEREFHLRPKFYHQSSDKSYECRELTSWYGVGTFSRLG